MPQSSRPCAIAPEACIGNRASGRRADGRRACPARPPTARRPARRSGPLRGRRRRRVELQLGIEMIGQQEAAQRRLASLRLDRVVVGRNEAQQQPRRRGEARRELDQVGTDSRPSSARNARPASCRPRFRSTSPRGRAPDRSSRPAANAGCEGIRHAARRTDRASDRRRPERSRRRRRQPPRKRVWNRSSAPARTSMSASSSASERSCASPLAGCAAISMFARSPRQRLREHRVELLEHLRLERRGAAGLLRAGERLPDRGGRGLRRAGREQCAAREHDARRQLTGRGDRFGIGIEVDLAQLPVRRIVRQVFDFPVEMERYPRLQRRRHRDRARQHAVESAARCERRQVAAKIARRPPDRLLDRVVRAAPPALAVARRRRALPCARAERSPIRIEHCQFAQQVLAFGRHAAVLRRRARECPRRRRPPPGWSAPRDRASSRVR